MCGLQRNTVQVNSISLSSQSESNLLQPQSLTQKKDALAVFYMKKLKCFGFNAKTKSKTPEKPR